MYLHTDFKAHIIAGKPAYAMKPRITGPEPLIVRKGRDLVLECQGLSEKGVKAEIKWLKLQKLVCLLCVY
jgi:hypothetical protein